MAYSSNPYAPRARKLAIITLKKEGLTCSEMARRMGVHRSTIGRWLRRDTHHYLIPIETLPSRPNSHPRTLDPKVVKRIIELRAELGRSAPVIQKELAKEGIAISSSVIGKKLKQLKLTRKRKQASYHQPLPRPQAKAPGELVQVDTIHLVKPNGERFYIRGAYAMGLPVDEARKSP